jgi:programmed cell death protein 5
LERGNEEQRRIAMMKRMLLRQGMGPDARERLARVRLANPQLAEQAEAVSIQLIQQGRRVDERTLKEILTRLTPKREIRIRRR